VSSGRWSLPVRGTGTVCLSRAGVVVSVVLYLCVLSVGCSRKPAAPARTGARPAPSQAAIDATIPPLPEETQQAVAKALPQWLTWADRLRGVYAALPPAAKQTMLGKGSYEFKLADLPEAQAKVIRDLVQQDPDHNIRVTLEDLAGKPLDLSKLTFAFKRGGDQVPFVMFAFLRSGGEFAPAPIGLWPSGVPLPPLPEKWRAAVPPDELAWADRIRKVYEALGPGPQQAMLSKGEYVFHLADLPKAQAETVREYFQQNEAARGWAESKIGSSPDLSKITLKFARSRDGEFVSFVRQAPNGDYSNLMIGAWPGRPQGR